MTKLRLLALAVLLAVAFPAAQGKRFITEKDLFTFTWIADPQISPDGETVAFVRVTVNDKDNRYETSLFAVPAAGGEDPRRLTSGTRDTAPRWAPDGRRLAFVRAVEKDGKAQPAQIYLLPMDGGEARAITEGTSAAGDPVWSPDGSRIAFTSATSAADATKPDAAKPAAEHKTDVEVVTRAVYRANGNPGYVDNTHHSHIFTIVPVSDTVARKRQQVTDGEFDENGPQWSPDGATIYFPRPAWPSRTSTNWATRSTRSPPPEAQSRRSRRSKAASAASPSRQTAGRSRSSARCAVSRSGPTASPISGSPTFRGQTSSRMETVV